MKKLQIKPQELKIISVIAASENVSHAATILGMAQANVSKYLADVESRVLASRYCPTSTTCWRRKIS